MTGLHVEDQLETRGSCGAQHAIDHRVAFPATIAAVAARLWLSNDRDQLVGGDHSLLCDRRVGGRLLFQAFGKGLVLETSQNAHSFGPRIPVPGDEKIVLEE